MTLSLLWLLWGVVCFVSGAYLLGPSIYHRQLTRMIRRYTRRHTNDLDALDPEVMQHRIAKLLGDERVDPRQ